MKAECGKNKRSKHKVRRIELFYIKRLNINRAVLHYLPWLFKVNLF